jgi:hypothetical protein
VVVVSEVYASPDALLIAGVWTAAVLAASIPVETLYAESGTESFPWRTSWLTRNYLLKLSHKPRNPMFERAKQITSTPNPLETQMHTKPNQKGYLPSKPGYKTLPTATGTPIMLQIPTTQQPTNL